MFLLYANMILKSVKPEGVNSAFYLQITFTDGAKYCQLSIVAIS